MNKRAVVVGAVIPLLIIVLILAKGWNSSEPTPIAYYPASPTSTPVATASPTPTASANPIPTHTKPSTPLPFTPTSTQTASPTLTPTATPSPVVTISILLDDFKIQPFEGEAIYGFNRLGGDRGAVNGSLLEWSSGRITTTISPGASWGGMWMSLNHPIGEGLPLNFSKILPPQIRSAYQSQITGITAVITNSTPDKTFRLELKENGQRLWNEEVSLTGESQVASFDLPPLENINEFLWILDQASANDFVTLESVTFTATTSITDTATAAFVWSYGMLLNNWDPATGLVRDKARDVGGNFDAIQATGSLAAATALAEQLGIVGHDDAIQIVNRIGDALLNDVPRFHGLWPHWVNTSSTGKFAIVNGTEWSSIDTIIAVIGLLGAQNRLGLDTSDVEQMLQLIDWNDLVTSQGISHGYAYSGDLLPSSWDVFGGESWLVELAYAAATAQIAPIRYDSPKTANGSGFIDELPWLFVPQPLERDYWGTDWTTYRIQASDDQLSYYRDHDPESCFSRFGLFGLSAAEIPHALMTTGGSRYEAFGLGGQFAGPNDGSTLGMQVIVPHYSAMIASLRPQTTIEMWSFLIDNGYFSPLNNVESLAFPSSLNCDPAAAEWNHMKGSWNLSLQTLGWGRYLVERNEQVPTLWSAAETNQLLSRGYKLLVPGESVQVLTPTPASTPFAWSYERECEQPDEYTVGQTIERADADNSVVHGQFGTTADFPWPEQPGYVKYTNIDTPQIDRLFLQIRYSKNSPLTVPILIFIDDEPAHRAVLYPANQGSWDQFAWTKPIFLGNISSGVHTITFFTEGQQYGVADLDKYILATKPTLIEVP